MKIKCFKVQYIPSFCVPIKKSPGVIPGLTYIFLIDNQEH
jgi:hypothetical protein